MMSTEIKNSYSLAPFVLITLIYFIVGFFTTINGQFQAPLQIAFLSEVELLKNTLTTLIPFFFFLGYLLNSQLGGKWINKFGYKPTLMRALLFMILGLIFYLIASFFATNFANIGLHFGVDYVPLGYFIFLLGSFFIGTSAAILQVVINPYVNAYDLPNTQPVQRMNIVCAINSLGTTIAPFFVTGVIFAGVAMNSIQSSQLIIPLEIMIASIVLVTILTYKLKLPDIKGTFSNKKQTRSIWSFSHLKWGVIAIFFYVGAEVAIGVNINLHAIELIQNGHPLHFFGNDNLIISGIELGIPALLATIYWGGFMVGRALSSFIRNISARIQLCTVTIIAIILTTIAIFTENLWILVSVGLCHSIMWGAIFSLAIDGLKEYTSKASGVFMMGVFGGAIFPLIQGLVADSLGSWQWTWGLIIICELVILYYALVKSKIIDKEIIDLK
ncbi:MAG: MFS transporter [Candidatus Gastranaerophilales bacterium]